ncbi:hypothetical protein Y10_13250 [Neptunitalea sp. Y10]|uniref:Uncharacterized protein n=1 Tax=Neptunitalea lumnitzerae TaxID=2965509 RepID=A0ABQ5MJ43_9FLAO|nr:hypothetical protein Y10_13250 [Neptunitalea sp. Y10]
MATLFGVCMKKLFCILRNKDRKGTQLKPTPLTFIEFSTSLTANNYANHYFY